MKMQKTLMVLSVLLANVLMLPLLATAANGTGGGGGGSIIPEPSSYAAEGLGKVRFATQSVDVMLDTVANYVVGILVIVAIFYILWAGYTFVTSSGETEKVNAARQRIMYAAIGIVVALLAKGIVALVLNLTSQG